MKKSIIKLKIINLLLILTSLLGYLEWSGNSHSFLFQAECEIISKLFKDPVAVFHPFTIVPMIGQLLLVITLFQKTPSKILTLISITCLGILLVFMLVVGVMGLNYKIILSTLPFITTAFFAIRLHKNRRPVPGED
jgi:uncharacterized membrane protein (UPF0136 family)